MDRSVLIGRVGMVAVPLGLALAVVDVLSTNYEAVAAFTRTHWLGLLGTAFALAGGALLWLFRRADEEDDERASSVVARR